MIESLIIDTETTGFEEPEVIEMAWMRPEDDGGMFLRFSPSKPISWGALATHHILPSELDGFPPADTAPLNLPLSTYLIGHNIDFDWKALGCPEGKRICTLAMARDLWPECDSHSLTALMYFTHGPTEETKRRVKAAHSALDDVFMCKAILETIIKVTKITNLAALYEYSEQARVPKIMSFGKFKGEPISAVDRGYANWYRRQPDTDPYVLAAFRKEGLIP